jgi:hypothetical protein
MKRGIVHVRVLKGLRKRGSGPISSLLRFSSVSSSACAALGEARIGTARQQRMLYLVVMGMAMMPS